MTLNKEQIQRLYKFTTLHYVEFYDVQTELVDHLANGIEAQWEETPKLKFEEALNLEFKKFGIFGFSDIVEQKTNALSKHYRKLVWKFTIGYFKFPKIIATLFSIWALYTSLSIVEYKNYIVIPLVVLIFVFQMYFLLKARSERKSIKKETGKNWLFLNVSGEFGGLIHCLNLGIYIPNFFPDNSWSLLSLFVFSVFAVLHFIVFFVSVKIVSPQLKTTIAKQFPEYKFI